MNAAIAELQFDADKHEYWLGPRRLPSVTQALSVIENTFERVPPAVLEKAREFGRHCHTAIDYFNKGELDEETLDPELAPYLAQYKQALLDLNLDVAHSEERVHSRLGYAGTLDIRGTLGRRIRRYSLIDLKSGALPKTVGPQTAAYREACADKPRWRYALQLARDSYKLVPCDDPADFSRFLSALNIFRTSKEFLSWRRI